MRAVRDSPFLSGFAPPPKPKQQIQQQPAIAIQSQPVQTQHQTPIATSVHPTQVVRGTTFSSFGQTPNLPSSSSLSPKLASPGTLRKGTVNSPSAPNEPKLEIPPPAEMKPFTPTCRVTDEDKGFEAPSRELLYQIGLSDSCRNWESQFVYTSSEVAEAIGILDSHKYDANEQNRISENWHMKKIASIDQQILHTPPVR